MLGWLEERLNLTEIFSFLSTFGLAYGDVDTRKPLREAVAEAFKKPLPAYAQWPQVLGLLTFVLFLFQMATGVLLAFYYQPAPATAYGSVLTIVQEATLGWYIHQMHYWGSNVLIGLLMLRMVRLFLHGVYRAPRELVWVLGGLLVFLSVYAGISGSLLPWDQQAYWSTIRSLEVLAELPFFGWLADFLVGGVEVQGLTLTRFYILHVVLLPLSMFVLFYLHFAAVRRVGLSRSKASARPRPLYPGHLADLATLLFLIFGAILTLAVLAPAAVQNQADPFASPAGIHPPWYLLPAFGLIEVLPSGAGGGLISAALLVFLALPFLDRNPGQSPGRRPLALLLLAASLAALVWLGYLGYALRG
jgi:ubiquinol-cytochrome c reductase cytochrome b subunit